jgi:Flp pilus assembly protein TadG
VTSNVGNARPGGASGQSLLEFALILPVMLLIVFSIFDLGRAVYAYTTIAEAARVGARIAIVDQNTPAVQSAAANYAVALGVAPGSVTVQYLKSDLSGPCSPVAVDCIAEVKVPYTYTAIIPVLTNLVGSINMSSTTQLPIERSYSSPTPTPGPSPTSTP